MSEWSITVDTAELNKSLRAWSEKFGETSEEALVRLAVRTAAHMALWSYPVSRASGTATKKKLEGAIWAGIRRTTIVKPKNVWTFMRKMREPRVQWKGKHKYFRVHRDQFTMDAKEVNRFIDRKRGGQAAPPGLGVLQRRIIPHTTLKKLTEGKGRENRIRRAGLAKGGWIGAGLDAQKWVAWQGKRPLGSGWLGFAHKWARYGRAWRTPGKDSILLTNSVKYCERLFDNRTTEKAWMAALNSTLKWYKSAVAALDKKKAA